MGIVAPDRAKPSDLDAERLGRRLNHRREVFVRLQVLELDRQRVHVHRDRGRPIVGGLTVMGFAVALLEGNLLVRPTAPGLVHLELESGVLCLNRVEQLLQKRMGSSERRPRLGGLWHIR